MNPDEKRFFLNRAASEKQIRINSIGHGNQALSEYGKEGG